MKSAILVLLSCLGLWAQRSGAADPARLEGVAVDALTQQPLAGVHVSLVSTGAGTNLPEPDDAYGAISDRAGQFSIGRIRPGTYILAPSRTGFVYAGEKPGSATLAITLKAGERNAGYRIAMTPEAVVAGRVLDEFGDPVQGAEVRVVPAPEAAPYGVSAMRAETDDRGEYRISGVPGAYYVEASVHPLQSSGPPEVRTDGSLTTPYATTYYPGALARERGKTVDLAAGRLLSGIDIHVAHRRSLRISGRVTGLPEAGANPGLARATVTIRVFEDGAAAEDQTTAAADGSFTFANLAPSEYHLEAFLPAAGAGTAPLYSPVVKATVENDDATVTLPLTGGEELAGRLAIEGEPAGQRLSDPLTVHLLPVEADGRAAKGGQVAPDGSFAMTGILPGVFRLTVEPLPDDDYVKSVQLGGVELAGGEVDLSKGVGGAALKITVSRNGGQVSGSVLDEAERQMVGRRVFVVLAADVNSFASWRSVVSSDSTFSIRGIRPGKYRLFVADPGQFGDHGGFEPLKAMAARAEEIEIKEGDRMTRTLRSGEKGAAGAK